MFSLICVGFEPQSCFLSALIGYCWVNNVTMGTSKSKEPVKALGKGTVMSKGWFSIVHHVNILIAAFLSVYLTICHQLLSQTLTQCGCIRAVSLL